jgi:phosphoglycolate phosphatase-like HAD superfamily hydrolase
VSVYLRSFLLGMLCLWQLSAFAADPLPSWRAGPARERIESFVTAVTTDGSPDYVPPAERIAVFDNDGCLWSEQPMYAQLAFALERVRTLAPAHPEWREQQPFKGVLEGDLKAVHASGEHGIAELVMATHADLTSEEFTKLAGAWLASARHPRTKRPYTGMVYQPMLELLEYLRQHGFKTYIVTGGGVEFVRAFAETSYGIPPEQVIGSSIKSRYEVRDGKPAIVRLPELDFIDDKAGKPIGIQKFIGRRPIAAFGNSDGDFEMLEWVTTGPGRRLGLLVHHDDTEREYAYDRSSSIGRLARGLDEASARNWVVTSMRQDWLAIYPPTP